MSLPRKIMEQCRLCPAKLWSNADLTLRNHRAFVLCPAKSWRLRSLPRKIMEQCRLCSAKSWIHSFRGQQMSSNLNFFTFFSNYFCKSLLFQRPLQPFGPLFKEKIFCVMVPLTLINISHKFRSRVLTSWLTNLLAALSSSRSVVVRWSVRPLVRPSVRRTPLLKSDL